MRLQLEIIKKTDDDSIYAWAADISHSGLLASWPTAFAESGNIIQINSPDDHMPWVPPAMTSIGLEMKSRYQRFDPHQQAIDAQYNVHTITTALPPSSEMKLFLYCGPCGAHRIPITQHWKLHDRGKVLGIIMKRFGATWQRVDCHKLLFTEYTMYEPSRFEAYTVYYVKQQGL